MTPSQELRKILLCCKRAQCRIDIIDGELVIVDERLDDHDDRLVVLEAAPPAGVPITVVANYSALPDPTTVSGQFYFVQNSQGTAWLPGDLGGTYYKAGLYYSNGVDWDVDVDPFEATQAEVDAGLVMDRFVTAATLAGATTVSHPGHTHVAADVTDFTEASQDAVGAMIDGSLIYVDATPLLTRAALTGVITAPQGSNTTSLGTFTKAELDGAVSDGNVLYVGDITQYTNEDAQDSVGGALTDTSTIDFTYNDGLNQITADVIADTSVQKIEITKNSGAVVGTRKQLNLIEGTNVTLTIADDAGNNQVDITINGPDVTSTSTTTLTNKRITQRVTSLTSSATPTINTDACDAVDITALAVAITSMTTNLSGAPTNFQKLIFRIKDNGTARAITWDTKFEARGVALPTTTVISKVLTVGFIYDTTSTKWGCVASVQEA